VAYLQEQKREERGNEKGIKPFSFSCFGTHVRSVASIGKRKTREGKKIDAKKRHKKNWVPAMAVRYAIVSAFCFEIPRSPDIQRKR
jgi:hypothetical protein